MYIGGDMEGLACWKLETYIPGQKYYSEEGEEGQDSVRS